MPTTAPKGSFFRSLVFFSTLSALCFVGVARADAPPPKSQQDRAAAAPSTATPSTADRVPAPTAAQPAAQQRKKGPRFKCKQDRSLIRTAKYLADTATLPEAGELVRIARSEGSDAMPVRARFGAADDLVGFRAFVGDLRKSNPGRLSCGWVQQSDLAVLVVGGQAGRIVVTGPNHIQVRLSEGFKRPYIVVRGLKGEPQRVQVNAKSSNASILIPREWGRPVLVQLVAANKEGPRPIAERWLGGIPGDSRNPSAGSPPAWLDSLRSSEAAPAVRRNQLLSQEASRHAQTVCDAGRVAHALELGEDPESRLRARGIEARVVGEAVARARDTATALSAIARSPSHRMTMTDGRYTDAGFGTAMDEVGRTCVVVMMAAWPRVVR